MRQWRQSNAPVVIAEINLTPTASHFQIRKGEDCISARSWGTAADCVAIAILVHGLGAHSGWFEAFARQLKVKRMCVIAPDHRGFGERRKEQLSSYNQWVDDLITVFDYLKQSVPDKPIYVMGNSMGALVSVAAAEHINPDGLVLFSPGFDGHPQTFSTSYRLRSIISALLAPNAEIALPYGIELCTRDQGAIQWLNEDPEKRFRIPGKMLLELLKLSSLVRNQRKSLKMPVLMLAAGHDRIVDPRAYNAFFRKLSAPDKQAKKFPDAWHDLMFDPQVDEVADEVLHWISQHMVEKLISGTGGTGGTVDG